MHGPREFGTDQRRLGHDPLDRDELPQERRREVARADARGAEVSREAEAEAGARVGGEGLGVVGARDLVEGLSCVRRRKKKRREGVEEEVSEGEDEKEEKEAAKSTTRDD